MHSEPALTPHWGMPNCSRCSLRRLNRLQPGPSPPACPAGSSGNAVDKLRQLVMHRAPRRGGEAPFLLQTCPHHERQAAAGSPDRSTPRVARQPNRLVQVLHGRECFLDRWADGQIWWGQPRMAAWRQTCWLRSAVAECWPTPALNCMTDSQLAWMSNVVRQLWATCGTRACRVAAWLGGCPYCVKGCGVCAQLVAQRHVAQHDGSMVHTPRGTAVTALKCCTAHLWPPGPGVSSALQPGERGCQLRCTPRGHSTACR